VATLRTYKTEGIVLKRTNFGEADKIVTFYTKDYGKLVALAKGVRRLTSRKRGSLEIFNQVVFFAAKGKSLDIITEVETRQTYSQWRKDLKKVGAAYEMAEMVDRLTAEGSEQKEIYELLCSYLQRLKTTSKQNLPLFVNSFGQSLLRYLGFWPKNKSFPANFNVEVKIEEIIERELMSKRFLLLPEAGLTRP